MHSIELLLDNASDAAVRAQWQVLVDAGLPSQARHTGATNAPHLTLVARLSLDTARDDALGQVLQALPVPAHLGALLVFGRGPRGFVLARAVVVGSGILGLHSEVHNALRDGQDEDAPHTRPGAWTPHVTLASRLTAGDVAAALDLLDPAPIEGSWAAGRRWDSDAKAVVTLG